MQSEKISVSLDRPLVEFLENYKLTHDFKSRSQVVGKAVLLLQSQFLEEAYLQANQETDPLWDNTIADGLNEDETW
jgi:antitoxin ParD1/3/4